MPDKQTLFSYVCSFLVSFEHFISLLQNKNTRVDSFGFKNINATFKRFSMLFFFMIRLCIKDLFEMCFTKLLHLASIYILISYFQPRRMLASRLNLHRSSRIASRKNAIHSAQRSSFHVVSLCLILIFCAK